MSCPSTSCGFHLRVSCAPTSTSVPNDRDTVRTCAPLCVCVARHVKKVPILLTPYTVAVCYKYNVPYNTTYSMYPIVPGILVYKDCWSAGLFPEVVRTASSRCCPRRKWEGFPDINPLSSPVRSHAAMLPCCHALFTRHHCVAIRYGISPVRCFDYAT
jgi:hypothetical protein